VLGNLANITLFSSTLRGPEQYLAGEPLMVVTLVAAQIVVTAMLTSVLATRSSRAALLSRHQLPGLSMRKVL